MDENYQASEVRIDACGWHYRDLNARIRETIAAGAMRISLEGVCGQRYIGCGITKAVEIEISGIPGNDLGAFMRGPRITVRGNAQDGVGNTMDDGEITVHGRAGDVLGLAARGGKLFIRDSVGYRAGIHMKEYGEKKPVVVIGGWAQDFLGEYMAGGVLIVLGLAPGEGENRQPRYIGTGMHGGVIYLRGEVAPWQLGKEVGTASLEAEDGALLEKYIVEFSQKFGYDAGRILGGRFTKLYPRYLRPYGQLYAY